MLCISNEVVSCKDLRFCLYHKSILKGVFIMFYLGIDVGKFSSVATLIDDNGSIIDKSLKFTNSTDGANSLLELINSYILDSSNLAIAMESTGHYWLSIFSFLAEKDFSISIINPIQIKSFRKSFTIRKVKNDFVDSILIANYLRIFNSNNFSLPNEKLIELKQLCRHRHFLVGNISDLKRKSIAVLDRVFPEYQKIFSDTFGTTSLELLSKCPTPEDIVCIDTQKLCDILSTVSRGRINYDKVSNIQNIAKKSFGIKFALDGFSFELKQLIAQIQFLESQLKDLENEINSIYLTFNCYLSTIPGISNTLAAIILSEIGDINKFSSPAKLVAFAGIDPSVNQSGEFLGTENTISKRGSPFLRRALFLAAFVAENNNPTLKTYYQKKIKEGKHHYVATGAVARKLAFIAYGVLKEHRPFKDF